MFCALFTSHLLLATARLEKPAFEIVAIISLHDVQMNRADNGNGNLNSPINRQASTTNIAAGLQCHTAPFSWKITFESDQQLYEFILCACTLREEEEWTVKIRKHIADTSQKRQDSSKSNLLGFENSVLCLDIKSLGPVFGLPGTLLRRQSIQRAATTNHRKHAFQVIIRNTYSLKENGDSPIKRSGTLGRSRSFMSTNNIPLLAPRRDDRQRVEQKMCDVWSKDRLPYPGMTGHRGVHLIRTSASSVMRRISFARTPSPVRMANRRIFTHQCGSENDIDSTSHDRSFQHQTDGASSPTPDISHPRLRHDLEYQDPNPYSKCMSMIYETDVGESIINQYMNGANVIGFRKVSDASTIVASSDLQELEAEKGKVQKPKTLFKAFSTESIRRWFH